jgi:hypothetical protein
MKKNLLTLIAMFSLLAIQAQCIVDTSLHTPGIYPPFGSYQDSQSNTVLPIINPGVVYSEVIQIVVPTDTMIDTLNSQFPATVDSFKVTNFSGLPPGFSYECYPLSCVWPGGGNGCITISGNTSTGYLYPLTVDITGYVRLFNVPLSGDGQLTQFVMIVGYLGEEENSFKELTAYPNPAKDEISIQFENPRMEEVELSIIDYTGRIVKSERHWAMSGMNNLKLDLSQMSSGLYTYRLQGAESVGSQRFLKQ